MEGDSDRPGSLADPTERFARVDDSAPLPSSAPSSSNASVPPPAPVGTSRASLGTIDIEARPARIQMIVALLLGLVLVATPLYLWQRPRAEPIATTTGGDAGAFSVSPPLEETKVVLGEPKVRECQDPGPKKTPLDSCDRVLELEKAFAKSIEENGACVPKDAGGGTVVYVADVNFKKKSIVVVTPKEGRTLKNGKAIETCRAAVKGSLAAVNLDAMVHQHARYKLSIAAIYPGSAKVTPSP